MSAHWIDRREFIREGSMLLLGGMTALHMAKLASAAPAKKLKAVLWVGGFAHDYEAIPKVLTETLPRQIPIEIKVVQDGSFLDSPDAERLDVILMNHCHKSAEGVLSDQQKQKLLKIVSGGVGVVAIHASYYSFLKWDEYHELYGARFTTHGSSKARVLVRTVDKKHPITKDLAESFEVVSELYQSTPLAKDCHVLARAKEIGTDEEFPSVWTRMYKKGRIVTVLPGHWPDSYRIAGFQKIIASSALWAAGQAGEKCQTRT